MQYALGEDQVMYYKMNKAGLKQLTLFNNNIKHLDAGSSRIDSEKRNKMTLCYFYFKIVFWHRFIYLPENSLLLRMWDIISLGYTLIFTLIISSIKLDLKSVKSKYQAIKNALLFLKSNEYKAIHKINN